MDTHHAAPAFSSRRGRRSFPNINHLSLAPLSSRFPIGLDDGVEDVSNARDGYSAHTSYIEGRSAPPTPGILSRSSSQHRPARRVKYLHQGQILTTSGDAVSCHDYDYDHDHDHDDDVEYEDTDADNDQYALTKTKSASALLVDNSARRPPLSRRGSATVAMLSVPSRTPGASWPLAGERHHYHRRQSMLRERDLAPPVLVNPVNTPSARGDDEDTWVYRAGLAIASETRQSKGQSWLISRESSTRLLGNEVPPAKADLSYASYIAHSSNPEAAWLICDDEESATAPHTPLDRKSVV